MNIKHLEELIKQEESVMLEFKVQVDFETSRGKAKFIKEVLALANSPVNPAYLILGVEDKSKEIIGVEQISDERLQSIVTDWCRPPVDFDYHSFEIKEKRVGVLEIFGGEILHTFSHRIGFQDMDGKDKHFDENQVFVRHGSTTVEATLPEIIAIAQRNSSDLTKVVSRLDKLNHWVEEISYSRSNQYHVPEKEEPNEFIETTFVSLLAGLLLGWVNTLNFDSLLLLFIPSITFFVFIITSALRLTHFGMRHVIVATTLISTVFLLWFNFDTRIVPWVFTFPMLTIVFNGFVGSIIGLFASIILMFWRPLGF